MSDKRWVMFLAANVWAAAYCLAADQAPGWYLFPVAVYAVLVARAR